MGKGGVGKSTSAALTSLFWARKGFQVMLVSLDPAHNQSDIFEKTLSDKPLQITTNLSAIEIEQTYWIRKYLKDVQQQINRTYSYLTAFNLEKYFTVIKYSPGLEEYALVLAFEKIHKDFEELDYLVFDMPPTALSLKFFSLPSLSLVWVDHLLVLREEIIKKRELITKIKLGRKEIERDKVLKKIDEIRRQYQKLKAIFEDPEWTQIYLVLNPDRLSQAESVRIFDALKEMGIPIYQTIQNKMGGHASCEAIEAAFSRIPRLIFPYSEKPLIGINNLAQFLDINDHVVSEQIGVR
jgi:arsenite-transporting ATPase